MEKRSYGQFMSDTFSNPMVERFQARSTRRLLVTVMLTWTVVQIALVSWMPDAWWAWGPMLLLFFPMASMINMSVRGVTEIPLSHLDDRLAQMRMKAFHDAYYLGVVLALVGGIWTAVLYGGLSEAESKIAILRFSAVGALIFGGLAGLPAGLLALRLPDESADEG
ncbi:MAG: hypothetical protein AAGA33_03160 [Pseudomonadota bacterium]